jgi:hypothetical protein
VSNTFHGPPDVDFDRLPISLQALETKIVYVSVGQPDGKRLWWDLNGNRAGAQGLILAPHMSGFMHTPFVSLFSEGPYQIGAHYERTDFKKRVINLGVMVGVMFEPATSFRYRMLEERWWKSWSASEDGYLGCWTRTHGWRWLRVRLAEEPKTAFELDPVAHGNNFMQWDMVITATQPYWAKRKETVTWKNTAATATPWEEIEELLTAVVGRITDVLIGGGGPLTPGKEVGSGILTLPNRGTQVAHPKFVVSSPGRAWIADGDGRMVALPLLTEDDGFCLVDTDPTARTLTCATDPVDPLFFQILRNSQLLDFLLHDLTVSTLPVWRRFNGRFAVGVPPKSKAHIKVYHSDPTGTITAIMPQHFDMAYG